MEWYEKPSAESQGSQAWQLVIDITCVVALPEKNCCHKRKYFLT
jgi:hypothetical protein